MKKKNKKQYRTTTIIFLLISSILLIFLLFNITNIKYTSLFGYNVIKDFLDSSPVNLSLNEAISRWGIVKNLFYRKISIEEALQILKRAQLLGNITIVCIPVFIVSVIPTMLLIRKDRKNNGLTKSK